VFNCELLHEREFRFIANCKWVFTWWQYHYDNTTHKYACHIHDTHITYIQIHISHKITPLKTKRQNKESYTNSEGHITANEYSLEKKEKK
jgi:hypothetical protein